MTAVEHAYREGYKRAAVGPALKALKWLAKSPAARNAAGRAASAGLAYAVQPHIEAGLVGGDREPRTGVTNTRLLTALTAGLIPPSGYHGARAALGSASALAAPTVMRGFGERGARALGWEGNKLEPDAPISQRLGASLVGDGLVAGTNQMATAAGELSNNADVKAVIGAASASANPDEFARNLVDYFLGRVKGTVNESAKEILPGALKGMGRELGVASLGGVAGYGVGALLSRGLKSPSPRGMRSSDPESVDAFYRKYDKFKRNKTAIKMLMSSLGGFGGVAALRALEARKG